MTSTTPEPVVHINVVTPSGLKQIQASDISVQLVGVKAFGLSTLPPEWCPPFFVISSECLQMPRQSEVESTIVDGIQRALDFLSLPQGSRILVRSSGVTETLDVRGQLDSRECEIREVWGCAQELRTRLFSKRSESILDQIEEIHFVVQVCVQFLTKGHLSNERRLNREPRDFLVEFEPSNGHSGHTEKVAIRSWRTGKFTNASTLTCDARAAIGIALKPVGSWAMRFSCRIHFEWVWDGKTVFLVQGDCATVVYGIDPYTVMPRQVLSWQGDGLRIFRVVNDTDYATYKKLSNAKLYSKLGYKMPPFYVLQESDVINALLQGILTTNLESDLKMLTRRPLIIRTDGTDIPKNSREMLPRSDELRTFEDAKTWLLDKFATIVKSASLEHAGLCLIAHHFIPSVASAWARAEPGKPIVRIESLWGIPEGLYWYSHDTFEVDTGSPDVGTGGIGGKLKYSLRQRCRYKGTFIASDDAGRWVPQTTDVNHDWARSITQKKWIFEIARTTRLIAESAKEAVSVMWFIGNHTEASSHQVLPWFHSASHLENGPKAAPRRKNTSAHDFVVRHKEDWANLKQSIESGTAIERVVMSPVDADLIRNATFASELAQLAKKGGFIVELSGGILSHAYYMLSREGCRVECVDLFGVNEEIVEFNKLVRDKIPSLIKRRGERIESVKLVGDALVRALRQKLVEEAFEVLDASSGDELLGELADVQEVLLALASALNLSAENVDQERLRKRKKSGGFCDGMMLLKTATPQSLTMHQTEMDIDGSSLRIETLEEATTPLISDPNAIPVQASYRKPDLRRIGGVTEKLLTFKTDIESMRNFHQQLSFDIPTANSGEGSFTLSIELDREKSKVRGKIRLQKGPSQLSLFVE